MLPQNHSSIKWHSVRQKLIVWNIFIILLNARNIKEIPRNTMPIMMPVMNQYVPQQMQMNKFWLGFLWFVQV